MTNDTATRAASTLWIVLLTVASTATTLIFACATPFPALAALAAVHMRQRDGLALIALAWVVSQAVGFCLLDYPRDAATFTMGGAIGLAALASVLAAVPAAALLAGRGLVARLAAAYVAGFVAFKAAIFVALLAIGGHASALSASVIGEQFVRNAAILAGLVLLYRVLVTIGVPAAPGPRSMATA